VDEPAIATPGGDGAAAEGETHWFLHPNDPHGTPGADAIRTTSLRAPDFFEDFATLSGRVGNVHVQHFFRVYTTDPNYPIGESWESRARLAKQASPFPLRGEAANRKITVNTIPQVDPGMYPVIDRLSANRVGWVFVTKLLVDPANPAQGTFLAEFWVLDASFMEAGNTGGFLVDHTGRFDDYRPDGLKVPASGKVVIVV